VSAFCDRPINNEAIVHLFHFETRPLFSVRAFPPPLETNEPRCCCKVCSFYVKLMARFCPISSPFSAEEQWQKKTGDGEEEDEQILRASASFLSQPEGNFK
jgi:hypothetical protein